MIGVMSMMDVKKMMMRQMRRMTWKTTGMKMIVKTT